MSDDVKPSMEALVDGIDLSKIYEDDDVDTDQINFWISIEYKEKYKRIQKRSRKKFGKKIQEAIMLLIDKAEKSEEIAS